MVNTLVFPDGVRLLDLERADLPIELKRLKRSEIEEIRAKVQSASIHPGFVLTATEGKPFSRYAEANVNAPEIWDVFCDLSLALFDSTADLLIGLSEFRGQPAVGLNLGSGTPKQFIDVLRPHKYQLSNDGYLNYGLGKTNSRGTTEVFVTSEKYFQVWFDDEVSFRSVMKSHAIPEVQEIHFIDEYPKIAISLPVDRILYPTYDQLLVQLRIEVGALPPVN